MTVTIEKRASYLIVTLDQINGISASIIEDLQQAFPRIEVHSNLRCVILAFASDRPLSTATDLRQLPAYDEQRASDASELSPALCNQIEKCPVPVIAAINGGGAGVWELSLACHIRIASPSVSFSLAQTRLSRFPGGDGLLRLAREIGNERAFEITESGRIVLAEEALRIGLINRMAPEDQLLSEAESLAKQISTMAPLAIRACLEAVTRGIELPLVDGLALELKLFASLFATNDVREGTSAFLEKRPPVFKGS